MTPTVSVVVPSLHADLSALRTLLTQLQPSPAVEVIVAVPREEWAAFEELRAAQPHVRWAQGARGRGSQMNAGAAGASGRWLLFLHADCRLPEGWERAIGEVERRPGAVGGCFRFALDDEGWRARVIEVGVRLRVALFRLPYGDQALFVRRDVFEAMGGYNDLPLMEDVDLVRRLKRRGRLAALRLPVVTSARRWREDGWLRRTVENLGLVGLYSLGVSPSRLAATYYRRAAVAVAMMARAPGVEGKRRLAGSLESTHHGRLREALFDDTWEAVRRVPGVRHVVVCEPPDAVEEVRARVGPSVEVIPQRPGDLGARLAGAFEDLARLGASTAVVVGSDLPDLPPHHVQAAADALRASADRVVLGPAVDGGYYLVGLKAPHPELFAAIDWSTADVLRQTIERARELGLDVQLLPPWADVDDVADLKRLGSNPGPGAARTRAVLAQTGYDTRRE